MRLSSLFTITLMRRHELHLRKGDCDLTRWACASELSPNMRHVRRSLCAEVSVAACDCDHCYCSSVSLNELLCTLTAALTVSDCCS